MRTWPTHDAHACFSVLCLARDRRKFTGNFGHAFSLVSVRTPEMDRLSKGGDGAAGNLFATLTTLLAVAALARNFLPPDWIRAIRRLGNRFTSWLDPFCYYTIQEFTGQSPDQNYEQVKQYLSGKGTASARRYVCESSSKSQAA